MILTKYSELAKIRNGNPGKKIVFCSGTFDLTHAGHVLFFEDCKKYGDILFVAVGNDFNIRKLKATARPLLNENIRIKTVDSFKPVDYCMVDIELHKKGHPIDVIMPAMKHLKPDIYIVNQDAFDIAHRESLARKMKARLVILDRWCPPEFENISTTKIIEKIKKS